MLDPNSESEAFDAAVCFDVEAKESKRSSKPSRVQGLEANICASESVEATSEMTTIVLPRPMSSAKMAL